MDKQVFKRVCPLEEQLSLFDILTKKAFLVVDENIKGYQLKRNLKRYGRKNSAK